MCKALKTARRRLSVSRMRENLTSGSRWQGMETRQGDGTEALSQETESNGSATPKSRRHPLTLPDDCNIYVKTETAGARVMESVKKYLEKKLKQLDIYVWQRLRRWARLRKGSRGHWNENVFETWIAQSGLENFYRSGICINP